MAALHKETTMSAPARSAGDVPCLRASALPNFERILAVGAHPDDESFGPGAILAAFGQQGASMAVLSFTHGEASTLGQGGDLGQIRERELNQAAEVLGINVVRLLNYPDGGLARTPLRALVREIHVTALQSNPQALLVFDSGGITGHPDHWRATEAAMVEAARLRIPVLAWAIPERVARQLNQEFGTSFVGRQCDEVDFDISVDRAKQLAAICAAPQSGYRQSGAVEAAGTVGKS